MPPTEQFQPQHLTPSDARALIAAAESGAAQGDAISARAWLAPALSIFLGALMGAFLLAGVYLLPVATAPEAALISAGYAAGILLVVGAYNLGRRVVTRGWVERYSKGVAISSGVFFVALALSFLVGERSLVLWVPLAIAVALPVAILGTRRSRS
ncbi:hypothetical protein [Herbiconiux solani]|uniref:hypothetical protein n=1 Tax=Herbiconiux solani TaxID=661329 RepID=UPI0008243926|nr:hypothetical protein [Herbiconiux solani]